MVKLKWRVTYDIVTNESAEQGDIAERGFVGEYGIRWPLEEQGKDVSEFDRCGDLNELIRDCHEYGVTLNKDADWLYNVDGRTDYRTGAVTTYAVHVECETGKRNLTRIGRLIERQPAFGNATS